MLQSFIKFASENPMKVYPFIFIAGDTALGSYGLLGEASWLWVLGSLLAIMAHALKVFFGKGGERLDTSAMRVSLISLRAFLWGMAVFAAGMFSNSYWQTLRAEAGKIKAAALTQKIERAMRYPWRYPLDIGWIAFVLSGFCYLLDSMNVFGLRTEYGGLVQLVFGVLIIVGSAIGFLTDRADLAGRMYAAATFISLPMAILSGDAGMMIGLPLYLLGNYILGSVRAERQSAYTIAQREAV